MPRIFREDDLQKAFDRDGFVKIKLLRPDKIKKLADYYTTVHEKHEAAMHMRSLYSTMETGDKVLITEVDGLVKNTIMEDVNKVLINYQPLVSSYLVKASGDDTELYPHQDLTFVNEAEHCSFNIWIPLQKTDSLTGQLRVVRGSHKIEPTLRVVPSYPWPFEAYKGFFKEISTPIDTEPGDCVVLNHSVIHGSAANSGSDARVAVIMGACSAPTDIYYYCMQDSDSSRIGKYLMQPQDYYHLQPDGRPAHGRLLASVSHEFKPVSENAVKRWIKTDPNFSFRDRWRLLYFTKLKKDV
jgi:hypothetical protein